MDGIIWLDTKAQLNYVRSHFSSLEIWALQSANFTQPEDVSEVSQFKPQLFV